MSIFTPRSASNRGVKSNKPVLRSCHYVGHIIIIHNSLYVNDPGTMQPNTHIQTTFVLTVPILILPVDGSARLI